MSKDECPLTDEEIDALVSRRARFLKVAEIEDQRAIARAAYAKGLAAGRVKGLERASDEAHRLSAEAWDEYDQTFNGFDDGRATALEQFALRMEEEAAAEAARKEAKE